jgi:hypothetical protein
MQRNKKRDRLEQKYVTLVVVMLRDSTSVEYVQTRIHVLSGYTDRLQFLAG